MKNIALDYDDEPKMFNSVDQSNESGTELTRSDSMDALNLEHDDTSKEDVEWAVAQFLLIFKEKYRLTQTALNFAVASLINIVNLTSRSIEQSVQEHLVEVDPHIDSMLSTCFTIPDPFVNLRTEYQQNKYYRDNLGLIVSIIVIIHLL